MVYSLSGGCISIMFHVEYQNVVRSKKAIGCVIIFVPHETSYAAGGSAQDPNFVFEYVPRGTVFFGFFQE